MKALFAAACVLLPVVAAAQWIEFDGNDDFTYYVEEDRPKKLSSGALQVWAMVDYSTAEPDRTQSSATLWLLDCEAELSGVKAVTRYAGRMGTGPVLDSTEIEPRNLRMRAVVPGSIAAFLLRMSCATRPR